jgi:hypothetical protein
MWRVGSVLSALVVLAAQPVPAAQQPSGLVIAVIQSSQAEGQGGRRILEEEAPVFSGDRIVTGPIGETQVRFRDDTRLVVGPNSSMVIDAFVFNDDDTARQISVNALRGAFRFITGTSRKDAYSIATPTALIGVRGTEFDFTVDPRGDTSVAVFKGITRICDRRRENCVEQRAGCGLAVVERGSLPRPVIEPSERERQLRRNFRYIRSQSSLLAEFRVNTASCVVAAIETHEPTLAAPQNPDAPPPPPPPPPPSTASTSTASTGPGHRLHRQLRQRAGQRRRERNRQRGQRQRSTGGQAGEWPAGRPRPVEGQEQVGPGAAGRV